MRRALALLLTSVGLGLVPGAASAATPDACTTTWDPTVLTGSFTDATHWDHGVPGTSSVACWSQKVTLTYTQTGKGTRTVATVRGGHLILANGLVQATGTGTGASTLTSLDVGDATFGPATGHAGALTVSGATTIGAGTLGVPTTTGSLTIGGALLDADLQVTGTTAFTGAPSIDLDDGVTLTAHGFDAPDGMAIHGGGTTGGVSLTGPLTKTTGTGTASFGDRVLLGSGASVTVSAGTLGLHETTDGTASDTLTATAPGTLALVGGTDVATVTGSGTVALDSTLTVPGAIDALTADHVALDDAHYAIGSTLSIAGSFIATSSGADPDVDTLIPPASGTSTIHDATLGNGTGIGAPIAFDMPTGATIPSSPQGHLVLTGTTAAVASTVDGIAAYLNVVDARQDSGTMTGDLEVDGGVLTTTIRPTLTLLYLGGDVNGHAGSIDALAGLSAAKATLEPHAGDLTTGGPTDVQHDGVPTTFASGASLVSTSNIGFTAPLTLQAGSTFHSDASHTVDLSGTTVHQEGGDASIGKTGGSGGAWDLDGGTLALPSDSAIGLVNTGGTLRATTSPGTIGLSTLSQSAGGTLDLGVSGATTSDTITLTGSTTPTLHGHVVVHDTIPGGPSAGQVQHVITCALCSPVVPVADATVSDDLTGRQHHALHAVAQGGVDLTVVTTQDAPTITGTDQVSATSARVSFSAPAPDGMPVSDYAFACSPSCGDQHTGSGTAAPFTLTGLAQGTTYSVTVHAIDANGSGLPSAAVSVTTLGPPGTPTGVSATPGTPTGTAPPGGGGAPTTTPVAVLAVVPAPGTVKVYFTALPGVTSYSASCTHGTQVLTATGPTSPLQVGGLTNNTTYACSVNGGAATSARAGKVPTLRLAVESLKGKVLSHARKHQKLLIVGTATIADQPAAGRAVVLTLRLGPSKVRKAIARTRANSKGKFSFTVPFTATGAYQAQLALGPAVAVTKEITIKRAT